MMDVCVCGVGDVGDVFVFVLVCDDGVGMMGWDDGVWDDVDVRRCDDDGMVRCGDDDGGVGIVGRGDCGDGGCGDGVCGVVCVGKCVGDEWGEGDGAADEAKRVRVG